MDGIGIVERTTGDADIGGPAGRHICLLFKDDAERLAVIARFFRTAGEATARMYITDSSEAAAMRELARNDLDFARPGSRVKTTVDAYYPEGRFEPETMCAGLEKFCIEAVRDGFGGCRCCGEMTWATRGVPGSERLLEYETMLSALIERLPFSGICQYDVRRFDGPTILSVLEIHPFMIVRGQVLRNPNYLRTHEWLERCATAS